MINYLYILASLSLFHTALGAVAFAPSENQNGTHAPLPVADIVNRGTVVEEIVNISNRTHFAIILPKSNRTTVAASKAPSGTRVFYSHDSTTDSQYKLPEDFFTTSSASNQGGKRNKGFVQLTGCINMARAPQFKATDKGGVYHSQSSGLNGDMNLQGSRCEGYNHFVECVQPITSQFAMRCCNDDEDCPSPSDNQKCSDLLKGDYGACAEDRK